VQSALASDSLPLNLITLTRKKHQVYWKLRPGWPQRVSLFIDFQVLSLKKNPIHLIHGVQQLTLASIVIVPFIFLWWQVVLPF
jgi:hypothetical protein